MSVFESGMMVCFGASWPIAAYTTFKTKSVGGKSLKFSFLILIGYVFGIIHKILYSPDYVIILYILNMLFLLIDICLHIKYRYFKKTI